MQSLRRSAASSARSLRTPLNRPAPRRLAHEGTPKVTPKTEEGHVAGEPASPAHGEESFGAGTYITLGLLASGIVFYKMTGGGEDTDNWVTRLIQKYERSEEETARINNKFAKLADEAGRDRILLYNTPRNKYYDLKYPEQFNHGSPFNVPAGRGSANIDEVIAKYTKEQQENEAEKLKVYEARRSS